MDIIIIESDLKKGKGNRDGLIQQIITYVRDGKTVTRKQWVRSEFADHAKKNEEEKKKTMLKEEEKERKKHEKVVQEGNERQDVQNRKDARKLASKQLKDREQLDKVHGSKNGDKILEQYHKKWVKRRKIEEKEGREKEEEQKKNKRKEEKGSSKEKRSAYGQQDQTKNQNKTEQNIITQYTPPEHKEH